MPLHRTSDGGPTIIPHTMSPNLSNLNSEEYFLTSNTGATGLQELCHLSLIVTIGRGAVPFHTCVTDCIPQWSIGTPSRVSQMDKLLVTTARQQVYVGVKCSLTPLGNGYLAHVTLWS